MIPIGIWRVSYSLLAKKYAVALATFTASGVCSYQVAGQTSCGSNDLNLSRLQERIGVEVFAFRIRSVDPFVGCALYPCMDISMLDWPEQIHTSPMRTFFKVTLSPSLKVISYGPPASGVAIRVNHFPSSAVITQTLLFDQVVVITTFFPGSDLPQIATSDFCCRTIWSAKIGGSSTFAASINTLNAKAAIKRILFIEYIVNVS